MSEHLQTHTGFKKYYHLMRPHTLTASFVPVLVGTACARYFTVIRMDMLILMLIACLLIQAATNMFNEYFDYKRGLDDHTSVGIGGAIVRNGMSPKSVYNLAVAFYIIAAIIGIYICANSSWLILLVGILCMAVGYFYTGGPVPISWTPFGEIFAGFFMGYVIIMITFYIQTGHLHAYPAIASIPISINIAMINMANNIRDRVKDKESGRKTFVILVGKTLAIYTMAALYLISFLAVFYLVFTKPYGSLFMLLVLLSFNLPIKAVRRFLHGNTPLELMPAMKVTGQFNTVFGLLFAIGLYIAGLTAI
ncbi:1,4-dihydroxy-2-naphthoate polyprenyltransferase [Macrococcoides canis]|uniref:1,4-dihydroxy-2-naphthoate octaprenyltransferase n=1 Tax=Macrococcoides canis TaxID=1855823 RepID=A0A4R6C845_9STAP|nr:1,4-dihydroxy-2-naphthoate polyprenyltransferase [Macrococcus canis]TDM18706.1 1,4-dihydroxy-2-naphthoate polyprenyltransferase [Macrococcus canis]TDM21242.1 1,4-dihydroxy-2-naphthoate polyprenyltransferase [Macrococcus canis]